MESQFSFHFPFSFPFDSPLLGVIFYLLGAAENFSASLRTSGSPRMGVPEGAWQVTAGTYLNPKVGKIIALNP